MNPCDLIPDDAILWVTMDDDAPDVTTWEAFQGDNAHGEDGDALAFLEDVATALHARREYRGGGGAAPTYVVRWYPVPALKHDADLTDGHDEAARMGWDLPWDEVES